MCWFIGTISRVLQGPRFKALWNAEIRFSEQESVGKCTRFAHARSQSSVKFWKIAENLKSMHPRCSGKTDLHLELDDVSLFPSPFSKKMLLNAMQMHQICVREISEFRKILKNRWKSEVNGSVVQWKNGSTPRIRWCRWPNRPRSLRKLRWISEPFSEPFLREIYFMLIMIFWLPEKENDHVVKADTTQWKQTLLLRKSSDRSPKVPTPFEPKSIKFAFRVFLEPWRPIPREIPLKCDEKTSSNTLGSILDLL